MAELQVFDAGKGPVAKEAHAMAFFAAGEPGARAVVEFFAARTRNKNTRAAYLAAVRSFADFCRSRGVSFGAVDPLVVSAYIESHSGSVATIRQHLSGLRHLFDHLVSRGVLRENPASCVRAPRESATSGKTPVPSAEEVRGVFSGFDGGRTQDLRDRALIGVLYFGFARVSAALALDVRDVNRALFSGTLVLSEKRGRRHEIPLHPKLAEYLAGWVSVLDEKGFCEGALFMTFDGRSQRLTGRRLERRNAHRMVKQRTGFCCHGFRGAGITTLLDGGGSLDVAQRLAGHASPATTRLYDRRDGLVSASEIEKMGV